MVGSRGHDFRRAGRAVEEARIGHQREGDDLVLGRIKNEESSEVVIVAEELIDRIAPEHEVLEKVLGKDLEKIKYERPFDLVEIPDSHYVVLADYVTVKMALDSFINLRHLAQMTFKFVVRMDFPS